jgi:ATP-dependent Lhr-like helicase
MATTDPLDVFLPPVREWFRSTLGEPTPAQRLGWPSIAAGRHTLILAPTGSGKTLAAFLACLDGLWRIDPPPKGVRVLYVSPLKALNNDIHRNLQVPLEGVAETGRRLGQPLPEITTAVRTGDTPTAERQRMLRKPPHVLITTPESLHLLLTSKARDTLRSVTHVIVDEIHALCGNKRGVFLALLLERLAALNPAGFVRIGLSATQRPLEEVAAYLGGRMPGVDGLLVPRPVNIVDAGIRRDLDLRVVSPVESFGALPEVSVWPSIYRLLAKQVQQHRSTLIFANNRRVVERITANLNQEPESADDEERFSHVHLPEPTGQLARAHHGSVALEVRQETEQALKEGRLPAVVSTASLEMGIDMGAVDLVCQVESPGNVARALQRVGRAGHIVGQKSKGRLIPKTAQDLLGQAVLAREMAAGRVEAVCCPQNCLDILAQQIVAMVAMEPWDATTLFALARQAYPYRDLSAQAFETTLEMMSGRYRFNPSLAADGTGSGSMTAMQPRVSWDRVHNRILALPGSQQLALVSGGTIPDTGQYAAYTAEGVRIGELDEEFIYERRVGDVFLLGTNSWRLDRIETDRVFVSPAEGAPAMIPFWRGESVGRSSDLGLAIGAFLAELQQNLETPDCLDWLQHDFFLDLPAARDLHRHVHRQVMATGYLPTDRTLCIEASRDQLGDWQVILLSPFGNRLHLALRLALEGRLRQRLGYGPQCLHHDDGLLIRLTDTDEPVLDLFDGLTPENVEGLILDELADSALFAMRFRQNAARALLLPRMKPGQRAPLWLQRLRGRDLLQVARRHPDFPIVVETFRECLNDHLDLSRLKTLIADIRAGRVEVQARRTEMPSPFASALLFTFEMAFMYQYDQTDADPERARPLDTQLLDQLVSPDRHRHLLDPRAIQQVERRLRGVGQPPRSATEMAEWLRRLGDLTTAELEGPMAAFLEELSADGRALLLELPNTREPQRWVLTEEAPNYRQAFGMDAVDGETQAAAAEMILGRFLRTHALVGLRDVLMRYPFEPTWAERKLAEWSTAGRLIALPREETEPLRWSAPENLEQMQRGTLALLRREVTACPPAQFVDFVLRWQGVHPETRHGAAEGLVEALERLQGLVLPTELWEQSVLPTRVPGYQRRWLDEATAGGDWTWVGQGGTNGVDGLAFFRRDALADFACPPQPDAPLDPISASVLTTLRERGASFVTDLAQQTGQLPGNVRASLWELLRRGLVTNDGFDVVRKGEERALPTEAAASLSLRPTLSSLRRRGVARPEGRWSLVPWGRPEPEARALEQAMLLLSRYGVVARELALLDAWMPPWRVLYEVLSRLELSGEVRRGYFVEGLSGAQFALPQAAQMLQDVGLPSTASAPVVLLHSLDPANLYGSGAALDVPLLDGGTRPLLRRAGNWLTLKAGRPILLIEGQGKRLTALPSASREDLAAAVACLPAILDADRGLTSRHKLVVDEWNGQPVTTTEGRELLETAGFVRDYQGMTLYGAWR